MTRRTRHLAIVLAAVGVSFVLLLGAWHPALRLVIHLPGFLLVLGGTLVATLISQSRRAVFGLLQGLPHRLSEASEDCRAVLQVILSLAEVYRQGDVRAAERLLTALPPSFLKTGLGLVIDHHSKHHVMRILQWHLSNRREEIEREVLILRTMGAYAPAFGMLGTLFGLIRMLYGLGDTRLDNLGMHMGFAMMTTVYGLILATLVFKPLAVKLERCARRRLAWMQAQYEGILMVHERQHPQLIKAYLEAFVEPESPPDAEPRPAGRLPLLKAWFS